MSEDTFSKELRKEIKKLKKKRMKKTKELERISKILSNLERGCKDCEHLSVNVFKKRRTVFLCKKGRWKSTLRFIKWCEEFGERKEESRGC